MAVAHPACRKPPPDEVVYTGAKSGAGGGTGGVSTGGGGSGGSGAIGPGDASAGGSGGGDAGGGTGGFDGLGGSPPDVPFTKLALLGQIAECTRAEYAAFDEAAALLRDATQAYANDASPANGDAAKNAWVVAMARWQEIEPFRFGPAARSMEPGGQDLRDQIYSFPLVNRCKVEEQIVQKTYESPGFPSSLVNGRGLGAIEYLLFYGGTDNACSPFSAINGNGTWAALGDELGPRKRAYAAVAANDVVARAGELVGAWDPARGNFTKQLIEPGNGSVYPTEQAALNAVSDGLFYIELEVKDQKLGQPLGISNCFTPTCPESVESKWALRSTQHLAANLLGFRRVFEGCYEDGAGLGFDDWLRAVGANAIADGMTADLAAARAAIDALDPPLEQALVSDPAKAKVVYDAIKKITDVLKTEFVTALNLELPKSVEGDND
jgi:predicted lipoprotein